MKKVIFILGAIVILVLLAGSCSQQIRETYKNINEIENEKDNCMTGCKAPTQLYGNCSSQIEKDENGNCYKTCPYECSDASPYANCKYDSQCMGCGFKKFRVNCDGSINPEWGDNSIIEDNSDLSKIHTPKPLQTFEASNPSDGNKDMSDYQSKLDSKKGNIELPDSIKNDNDNLAKNTNSTPYINPDENNGNLDEVKPGCCGDIHFHYYDMNSNPSGGNIYSVARGGGILSNRMQNGIQNAEDYKKSVENSSDHNSGYNYGAPGTQFPTDSQGALKQFTVDYEERPSVTGMFQVGGPLGANIGQYGNHIKGCNCPPCSSDVDPTK
tara:strand:+ start:4042 stop:5019 length:978 start_codon:yes stop_codon:yes gene_type:complete